MRTRLRIGVSGLIVILVVFNLILVTNVWMSMTDIDNRMSDVEASQQDIEEYIIVGSAGENIASNGSIRGNLGDNVQVVDFREQQGAILGVDSVTGEGIFIDLTYRPLPDGHIYLDVSDGNIKEATQDSLRNAQEAVKTTSYNPETTGMLVSLDFPPEWNDIDGGSAGIAIATHIAATDPDYTVNQSVVATGGIAPDGSIITVSDVTSKAEAGRDNNKQVIVTPPLSGPITVDGIKVVQVTDLEEALEYTLKEAN